ncbi:hypothetical protein CHS0354_009927 [Potamilus streckersoni]|uniref:Pre-rRNA-processing protein Ipi1 N-terminal domain-containing protein n=1 Tax=Potamilus streckersoni TaxID=2493646 RepID=A0AAE0TCT2_9BIVA|nr:hypothetical protein CHS0354_009927 [Potamilus streckersoni]
MGKSKKKRQDFQKVKLKVGKTLKKADNVTNASFKTRTIQITQQLKTDSNQPSTTRKLNIQDLLVHCQHFSSSVRHDGVTGLRELLTSHPELMTSHLAAVLEKTSELFTDKDPAVRKAVIKLLSVFYSKISLKQIAPFFPLLKAHLCCAMTHIYDDIKVDSLQILDILLEFYPDLVINKSSELFSNFIEQISRRQSEKDKSSRTLVSNPSSKMSALKWRTSVLERLHKFLAGILNIHRRNRKEQMDNSGNCDREKEVVWSKLNVPAFQPFPVTFSNMWSNPTFTIRSQVKEVSSHDGMGSGLEMAELVEFARTLIPLMLQCWVEAVISHTQQSSQGTGNLLRSDNLSLVSSVLLVMQLLLDCIHSHTDQPDISWLSKEYVKEFRQHFMINFPYSVHSSLVGKDKKEKNTKVTAEWINLSICDLMTNFIPSSYNQSHDGAPSWLSNIIKYLKDFLDGKYDLHSVGQHAQLVSKIVACLIGRGRRCDEELKELVVSIFRRYKGARFSSLEKRVYLNFFADLTSDCSELMMSEMEAAFFASLPELLPLVVGNHQLSALIVEVMKRQACQCCKSLLLAVHKSFHTLYGETMVRGLGPYEQKDLVSLLYYMPDITEDCHKILVNFCCSQVITEHLALYMIQVIQNRFLKVDFKGALSDPVKIGQHISFLLTLLLGTSSQDLERSAVFHGDQPHRICGMEVHLGQIGMDSWSRHQKIVEAVMQFFQQCPMQMLDIAEYFLKNLLDQDGMHTLPAVSAFGILCFVAKRDHISLRPQEDNAHFIKLCIATMHLVISTDSSANEKLSCILDSILHLSQDVLLTLNGGIRRICEVLLISAKDKVEEEHLSVLVKMATSLLHDEERRSALKDKHCIEFLSQLDEHVQAHLPDGTQRQWFAEFHYFLSLLST